MAAGWECPSLPMLSFPLKESAQTTFLGIKPMISAHYEEDSESFHDEIKQVDTLRQNALRPPKDYNGVSCLRRYFAQLHLIRERFPPETIGQQLPIDFAWKDAFTDTQYLQEGLQIEQASILYNIAALHSILGCRVKRTSEQEMKEAVTHFQCAAGAFSHLDDNFAINHASRDLTAQFVSVYKSLMLGQAQECLVEKSLKGTGRVKNLTIAKLAARVSEYYQNVARLLEVEPCNIIVKKHKDWPKLLKMKIFYFQALSHFYQGCQAEELGKQGELLAWYQLSLQKLSSIGKIPKNLGEGVREAAKNFYDHVNDRFQACKRQNDQVYHEPIPIPDTLEHAQGADLAKPVVFHPTDPKNLGKDIFSRLVPMRAYEAASVYSEEKAKLLRSVLSSANEKDEELEQFLLSLNAGEIDKLHQAAPSAPDNVLQQHKLLQGKATIVKKLCADVQELMKLSGEVAEDLSLIAEKRKEDREEEETFQSRLGARSPSQICAGLWKDADNYSKYHTQASKSNGELKSMFDHHYQYLLLLSGPLATLHAAIPKMTPMDAPAENSTESERWAELMGKVEQMRHQRKALVGQLRDQINKDDITKTLIGHLGSDKETFIDEKMRRHREIGDIIRKNLTAQENILMAVTEANAKKVQVRQAVQELTQQQESMFGSLVKAGTAFPLLQSKISEGLTFYSRLHGNVAKLRKRVLEVVATRNRERETTERRLTPERSPSPAPEHIIPGSGHHATPPPRPPKKAEFAGKPLAPEQQVLPNEAHHPHPVPSHPPPSEGQSTPLHEQVSSGTLDTPTSHQTVTQQTVTNTHVPIVSPAHNQSLEEQLQDLQRQQQLQLQALQGLNVTGESMSFDSQAAQNVIPPIMADQGPHIQSLGAVQPNVEMSPQGLGLQDTEHYVPDPNVVQDIGVEQQTGVIGTLHVPQEMSNQAGTGVPGLEEESRLPHPTQPSEQGDLLGLDIQGQAGLQRVSLEPMVGLDTKQETSQAIQNLQFLLQPPGDFETPTVSTTQQPLGQYEPAHQPPMQPHPSSERSLSPDGASFETSVGEVGPSRDSGFQPQQHLYEGGEPEGIQAMYSNPISPTSPAMPSPIPAPHSGINQFPQPSMPSPIPVSHSEINQFPQHDDRMPNVSQTGTEQSHTMTQGNEVPNSSTYTSDLSTGTHMGTSYTSDLSTGTHIGTSLPQSVTVASYGDNTVTINSLSKPIPAPSQSPPIVDSQGVHDNHRDVHEPLDEVPHGNREGSVEPPVSLPYSQTHRLPVEDNLSHDSTYSQPDKSQSRDLPSSVHSNYPDQVPPTNLPASHVPGSYQLLQASVSELQDKPVDQVTEGEVSFESGSLPKQVGSPPESKGQSSHAGSSTTVGIESSLPSSTGIATAASSMYGSHTSGPFAQLPTSSIPQVSFSHTPGSFATSLPQLSGSVAISSFRPIQALVAPPMPPPAPLNLSTPPSFSPLPSELTMPLQDIHSLSTSSSMQAVESTRYEALLLKQQEKMDGMTRENEEHKAQIADQRIQIESYKQQLLLLQQQVTQVATLQQKQEQEKTAASGQQAVLMQLLQQQQGMFSQQQGQLENMSKLTESHRKEQQDLESSYKQALAVEREQKSNLQNQLMQQSVEMQRLQQQLQAQGQQYQTLQLQLHQYHTQIQERDKQLVAFRDQHKQILQNLDQKHQQKVSQLVQQLQEYQGEVKKLRSQRQQPGLVTPLQPTPVQQFVRPPSVPGQVPQSPAAAVYQPQSSNQQLPRDYGQGQQTNLQPRVPTSQPQAVLARQSPQPQSFQTSTQSQRLPQPLQPTVQTQGYGQPSQSYQGYQQTQGGFQPSSHEQGQTPQGSSQRPPTQQTTQGFQQPPAGQISTSQQQQVGGAPVMRQDSQPFRMDHQQQPQGIPSPSQTGILQPQPAQSNPQSKEGTIPPTSSLGFMPRAGVPSSWQQQVMNSPSATPQQQPITPGAGQTQFSQIPPGMQVPQRPLGPAQTQQPQQFQGQFQTRPGGMNQQFTPTPQQQTLMGPQGFQSSQQVDFQH